MGRGQSFINVSTSCRRAKTDKQTQNGHNNPSVSKGPAFSSFIQQAPVLAWAVSELTDTSRNSRAAMKCCYSLYGYVGTTAMSVSYVGTTAMMCVSYVGTTAMISVSYVGTTAMISVSYVGTTAMMSVSYVRTTAMSISYVRTTAMMNVSYVRTVFSHDELLALDHLLLRNGNKAFEDGTWLPI